jgi:hypothetical protein
LKEFETFIKQQAIANSKEWFNKAKMSMDVVEALFTPILKHPRNEAGEPNYDKAPSLQVKIPVWDGRCDSEVFDSENNLLFPNTTGLTLPDLIPKQTDVKVIITIGGIWFAGGKFGVTFKLMQAIIVPKTYLARGKCHYPADDDAAPLKIKEERSKAAEEIKVKEEPRTVSLAAAFEPEETTVGVEVADSDDERADPDAEYSAPAAEADAPVKGRKKVVKK